MGAGRPTQAGPASLASRLPHPPPTGIQRFRVRRNGYACRKIVALRCLGTSPKSELKKSYIRHFRDSILAILRGGFPFSLDRRGIPGGGIAGVTDM